MAGGCGARGGAARALAEQLRGGRAVAVDSPGEKVGEDEGVAGELTVHPIWAEKGRRWELDGEGGAPKRTAMATAVWGLISAGVGHD